MKQIHENTQIETSKPEMVTPEALTLNVPIIVVNKDALDRKADLIKLAKAVLSVDTVDELATATARHRENKRLMKEVEANRKQVKAPVMTLESRIDEIAATFQLELEQENVRIKGLMDAFAQREAKRVEDEQKEIERQQAEANRKAQEAVAEAERIEREAAEIQRQKAEAKQRAEDAIAEQERIANLPKASATKTAEAKAEVKEAKAELKRVEAIQMPTVATEIKAQVNIETAMAEVKRTQTIAAPVVARAAGLTIKKETLFEVTDAAELYKHRPEWFTLEPKRSIIKQSITKETNIPGLKVWEQIGTGTRG